MMHVEKKLQVINQAKIANLQSVDMEEIICLQ